MTNLDQSAHSLQESHRRLQRAWEQAQAQWDDPVSRGFEKNYLAPFERQGQMTLKSLQQLAEVIAQAQRHVK